MKQKLITLFATLMCCMSMYADGALSGKFTINEWGDQVVFSQGNLQYRQSDDTYRFAPTQYTIQGEQNQTALEAIDAGNNTSVYIDLFGWGPGTAPYFHGTEGTSYPKFFEWGNEPITNGGNTASPWRTLTRSEWKYLFYVRNNAEERFAFGKVNGVNGLIILPDEWETPSGLTFKPSTTRGLEWSSDAGAYINTYENNYSHNTLNGTDWDNMEQAGAVFLPAAGSREGTKVSSAGQEGYYWSSEPDASETAYCTFFDKGHLNNVLKVNRSKGMAVRLVQEVPKLEVYTEFVEETGTLTYYYDMKRKERTGVTERYDPIGKPNAHRFEAYHNQVKKAVIDPSMKEAPLTSMRNMFYGYSNLGIIKLSAMTTIEGLENLNTTNVTNMENLFYGCEKLTSLNLSSFNTKNVTNMAGMFSGCSGLTSLNLSSFNTAKVTDMSYMFDGCKALTSLDLSKLNTEKVKRMNKMFADCSALTSVDVTSFNTENVSTMESMFCECEALQSLDLSSFNTFSVTDMSYMFYECEALQSLNLSSFNTFSVTDMSYMFDGCRGLTSLDLSSFDTSKVRFMVAMFDGCRELTSLDLTSFNIENVTDMRFMFSYCSLLTTIYCNDDWSMSAALTDFNDIFTNCKRLVGGKGTAYNEDFVDKTYARPDEGKSAPGYFTLKDPKPKAEVYTDFVEETGTLTYYYDMQRSERTGTTELYDPVGKPDAVRFAGYSDKVTKAVIDPSMKDAPLTSMEGMFYGGMDPETFIFYNLSKMTTIEGLENLNTSNVTDMNNMFLMCSSLTSLDLSSFNTSNVTNMGSMFSACSSLTSLDLSSFNTSNVTDMGYMFLGCNALKIVDVTPFDVSKVTNMSMMFGSCKELTTICCNTDWRTSPALTNSYLMFSGCNKIVGDKGTTFIDDENRDATYAHPDGGTSDPGYFSIYRKGDADGNGKVNAADIVAISNYIMGNQPAGFSKASADVNLDGVINIADIVALANILLND